MIKHLFFDLETTGLNHAENGIHQLAGTLFVDFKKVKDFNVNVRPFPNDIIIQEALDVSGKTKEEIFSNTHFSPNSVYKSIINMLGQHCDKFSKTDKIFLCGYNNASFDNQFLRSFWDKNNDKYFGSWFWSSPLDVFVLAAQYLATKRHEMIDFKLATVAAKLGIVVDETRLHDAMYDIELTVQIYEIVTGLRFKS